MRPVPNEENRYPDDILERIPKPQLAEWLVDPCDALLPEPEPCMGEPSAGGAPRGRGHSDGDLPGW